MGDLYVGFTLGDIVGLAHEHTITYSECAEFIEEKLNQRFPWIKPDEFYPVIKKKSVDGEDYCYRLIKAGKQLEEMLGN